MDKGYKHSLKDIITENIDAFTILQEESLEVSSFIDIEIKRNFATVVIEFKKWEDKSSRLTPTKKIEFLSSAIKVLDMSLERYNYYLSKHNMSEAKASYWKLKYESVKSTEKILDELLESNVRLIKENENLLIQIKHLQM